jgi:D-arginine dehydrogenase
MVSPADEDPVEPHDAWADDMVLAEGLARYQAIVTVPVSRVERSWVTYPLFLLHGQLESGPRERDRRLSEAGSPKSGSSRS